MPKTSGNEIPLEFVFPPQVQGIMRSAEAYMAARKKLRIELEKLGAQGFEIILNQLIADLTAAQKAADELQKKIELLEVVQDEFHVVSGT